MSASFTIYNGAEFNIITAAGNDSNRGFLELTVTETDGATHEITIHFDTAEGFALASRLDHLMKAISVGEAV